jgi:hypothetical protein
MGSLWIFGLTNRPLTRVVDLIDMNRGWWDVEVIDQTFDTQSSVMVKKVSPKHVDLGSSVFFFF